MTKLTKKYFDKLHNLINSQSYYLKGVRMHMELNTIYNKDCLGDKELSIK